jgi:hypothetical protein
MAFEPPQMQIDSYIQWIGVASIEPRARFKDGEERGKRAEKIREFRSLLIYDLWVFAWHCDVFSAPLSSSPSLSSCVSTLSADVW